MNHAAAPAPPPRGLLIKSAGLLTAVSPLCTWLLWDTLAAGLAFTAVSLFSQAVFIWLPQILAGTAAMPHAWLIPLGHLNLLAILSSLLLLTLAAAYACLLCIGKKTIRPAAGKTQATA